MKVLLRNSIPTPAQTPDFTIVDGKVTQNGRVYNLNTAPGVYFVMPFRAEGTVPHYDNSRTFTTSYRELRHGKETLAVLNAHFYKGFIAAYVVETNGDTVLLVNTTVSPAPDAALLCENLASEDAKLPNEEVLRKFSDSIEAGRVQAAKTDLLRRTGLNDALANQQLQIDLLMAVVKANPPAVKPVWWNDFVDAMSGTPENPNPVDRKGIPAAIAEVKADRASLNARIAVYKSAT